MIRMLASGACSAAALARSRTMEALVLNRSGWGDISKCSRLRQLRLRTITGHAGLAGNTSGDDNDLGALEGIGEA
jgi:hypothetical protein